ncbi:MAG: 3-phosphoglycerate dehydrogenase [Lachnospiraceae bacterium]|nr:3-phosphoglycerate dehydrogenase [Lachnospiraceae bacterium]
MAKVNCLNNISKVGLAQLGAGYEIVDDLDSADIALVRSAAMHELTFSKNLKCIARAGAGVNNIPLDRCADENIVVFNTPGANANAVKELAIAGMLLCCRDIVGGIGWVQTIKDDETVAKLVEKGKSKFAGTEIKGKKLGVIGLGAIGGPLANAAVSLGMTVCGCDPFLSDAAKAALDPSIEIFATRDEVYKVSDFITVHTPLIDDPDPEKNTKGMINKEKIALMKDGVVIMNFARDALVNDDDIEKALADGKVRKYITDFPNARTAGMAGVIAIPHLGASTEEAEDNCAVMAVKQARDYIENGNIVNSVNYPRVTLGEKQGVRLCVRYDAANDMLAVANGLGLVINAICDGKRGKVGYLLADVRECTDDAVAKLEAAGGVVRVIK